MTRFLCLVVGAAALVGARAEASTLTTLSFSGSTSSVYDPAGLFGASGTNYGSGQAISGTLSYDPTSFAACSSPYSCTYTITAASNVAETITFNGKTASFSLTGGTLQLNPGTSEQIVIGGSGPNSTTLSLTAQDGSKFFTTDTNPALSFGAVATINGNDSTNRNGESIGFSVASISATTAVSTPEPASLVVLGSLVGTVLVRRRRAR